MNSDQQQREQLYLDLWDLNAQLRTRLGHILVMCPTNKEASEKKILEDLLHLGLIVIGTLHSKNDVSYIEEQFKNIFDKHPTLKQK